MPSQQIPAAPVGGITSRRHAKLLLHLVEGDGGAGGGGASVKDLRLRRVVPPASATLDVSPECAAAAKPGSVQIQSTPPEPVAAAEDRERKPMLPRSKLVRDPGSFGYRRLLPFLNKMANKGSDISSVKDMPSENNVSIPNKELNRSDSLLADESPPVDGSQGGAAPVDSVEPPPVVKAGADREICDSVKEENKVVPDDLASTKPCLARCTRSKFVHHPSSFSYKRMLPFLMENDISSQEGDRAKFRRLSEEKQMPSDENDVQASGQIQSASVEVSLDGSAAEVQKATQEEEFASVGDPLSSEKGELTSCVNAVLAGGQSQLPVSEDTPEERNAAEVESRVEEKASKSDEKPVPMDSVELPVARAEGAQEVKDCFDSVKEETKIVPGDLASTKLFLPRCARSKFVPQPSSLNYKRMLPFLMENETSSQKGDMAKLQTASEEKQLTSPQNDVLASGNHFSVSQGSPEACYQAELDRIVEEITSTSDDSYLLKGLQLQSAVAVAEVSLDGSTAEVQKVTQEVLASDGDLLCPDKGELTSERNDVLAGGQCQLAVSDGSAKESNVAEAERIVEEKATKSDENSVLNGRDIQSAVSEVSHQDGDTDEMKDVTEKPALTSDGDESSGLTSDKGEFLMKDQPQLCDSKKLLQDNAELAEAQQCQSPESGCLNVGLGSPTKTVMVDGGADPHGAPERQDFVASLGGLLPDVGMICKPSESSIGSPLSAEGMSGCVAHAESGLSKVGTLRPLGSPCLEQQRLSPKIPSPTCGAFSGVSFLKKRGFSPKKLSPKKGILKRHTMGCRGICMCLDCSVFRLRADRAFEFSRKQMQEADDIIVNLLEEVASLRSLTEKSSGQQQQQTEACQRALRVEEVAKERRQKMLAELNSHCKIPGPRVKFAQYVEGKMASSPSSSSRRQPHL